MKKKFAAVLLALSMIVGLMAVPASAAAFSDVPEDHWAASAIERWNGYGVLNGHGDGTFAPDKVMTRAEFAQMLVNMLGLTAKSEADFTDVNEGDWYAEVIKIAVAAGIMNGYSDGSARPNAPVSFEEAAVMLCRALGLAQTTGGADWSKESIDKLTSLGMIGEGADEHLQVGVDCDRAVVAALASAVVVEYVNEDREEPISGEVNGVVVVVNNAKVEIKDATVAAPIVVESASVTLTNTKAENVVVGGTESSVTADKDSSVTDVAVSGSAPAVAIDGEVKGDVTIAADTAKVELNGEVAGSVTVEEGSTSVEIKGDGVDADKVVNNSTEDVTVNDETVAGKPEDDTTTTPTTPSNPGSGDDGDEDEEPTTPAIPEGHGPAETGTVTTAATCTTDGVKTYACKVQDCTDKSHTKTETIPKLGHQYGAGVEKKAASCTETGTMTYTCNREGCTAETEGHTKDDTIPALGHEWDADTGKCKHSGCDAEKPADHDTCTYGEPTEVKAATCTEDGSQISYCTVCGASKTEAIEKLNHKNAAVDASTAVAATCTTAGHEANTVCPDCGVVTVQGATISALGHKWTADGTGEGWNATTGTRTCTVCRTTETCTHTDGYENGVCKTCGKAEPETEECEHAKPQSGVTTVASTCKTPGSVTYTCTKCNEEVTENLELDPNNHEWGAISTTPDSDGKHYKTCTEHTNAKDAGVECGVKDGNTTCTVSGCTAAAAAVENQD